MQLTRIRFPYLWMLALLLVTAWVNADSSDYADALNKLSGASMQERTAAIEQLATVKEPRAILVLQALLDGRLWKLKADNKLVFGSEVDAGYQVEDASSGKALGVVAREDAQKITLNNSLRTGLRKTLGLLELNAQDASTRVKAVQAIAKAIDAEGLALLQDRLRVENDARVQDEIKLVLGLEQLNSNDKSARLAAIELLKKALCGS